MIFSIVICAYNAQSRISQTLHSISLLEYDHGKFEVLLVDNSSTDRTSEIASDVWSQLQCPATFRVLNEPRQGLSFARQKGIAEAVGDFILFCDDDNHLDSAYLYKAHQTLSSCGGRFILGGAGIPLLDTNDLSEISKVYSYGHMLAVGAQSVESADVTESKGWLYGAGLIIPRSAFTELRSSGFKSTLTDRKGTSLSTGGDVELCYALTLLGWRLYSSLDLVFHHAISKSRLEPAHLYRLIDSNKEAKLKLIHYQLLRAKSILSGAAALREYNSILLCYLKQSLSLNPRSIVNLVAALAYLAFSLKLKLSDIPFNLVDHRTRVMS
jgi:glycosyltransferase involved in cell wall biosynthesis